MTLRQPGLQGTGDELAAVVAAEVAGYPTQGNQPFHHRDEVDCRELSRHAQSQTLAGVFVEHREDAQLAPIVRAVADEVPSPDVVDCPRFGGDRARGLASASGPLGPPLDP